MGDTERPPSPAPGQLLVKVNAAALNPVDWKSASGAQAPLLAFQWPRTLGFDFSGVVAEVGSNNAEVGVGDAVFGMIRGLPQRDRGTLAEYVLVDAEVCVRCPPACTHAECAAVPLVAITAVKMFEACGLTSATSDASSARGPRVLITGGAGGVGTIAIQLAKAMFGAAEVVTTASAGAKITLCRSLGADEVLDYKAYPPWYGLLGAAIKLGARPPFDAVLVTTSGEAKACAKAGLVAPGGAMCSITPPPTLASIKTLLVEARLDPKTITIGVKPFLASGLGGALFDRATGATTIRRILAKRGATYHHITGMGNGRIMREVASLMADRRVRAVIDSTYALEEAKAALSHLKDGHVAGKVVVLVDGQAKKDA